MTIVEQGGGPAPQAVPDLIKETTTQTFVQGRHRGIEAPAGADRLLGALVRPLPSADADHRKGGPRGQGQGQAGQDEHRRASADSRPDGHPVDPGRDRLRQRPARRRFHGRAAGEPGQRLHRQAHQGHGGAGRAEHRRDPAGGRGRAGGRRCRRRRADLCRGARLRRHQHRGAWRASPNATSRRARSSRPSRPSAWCRNPSATTPP